MIYPVNCIYTLLIGTYTCEMTSFLHNFDELFTGKSRIHSENVRLLVPVHFLYYRPPCIAMFCMYSYIMTVRFLRVLQ